MVAGALRNALSDERGPAALFDRIGDFLDHHHLNPDPRHYQFAYRVMTEADGALARAVRVMTEGGFRLTARDIEMLDGTGDDAATGMDIARPIPAPATADPTVPDPVAVAEGLVARTQMQVEDFTDMIDAIRAETRDFGRDIAASADTIRDARTITHIEEVARLTNVMLARVQVAESRLAVATNEACALRAELEEARENARRDPLTDLPNRRAFEQAFALTSGTELVHVAVCDVDRFKSVNDRFGHAVGDRVLKAIGSALSESCDGHLVARYGGEEFAVLFVGVSREVAATTLEAARRHIAARRFRVRESNLEIGAVTFSAGMSQVAPGEAFAAVFGRADRLLYAAKTAGRNRLHTD